MAKHELIITVEPGYYRGKVHCNAGSDAACRNMPECTCENWDLEQDKRGWFHRVRPPMSGEVTEVIHRHTQSVDCNICEWMNADDPLECLDPAAKSFDVATIAITPKWGGDYYLWKPAK